MRREADVCRQNRVTSPVFSSCRPTQSAMVRVTSIRPRPLVLIGRMPANWRMRGYPNIRRRRLRLRWEHFRCLRVLSRPVRTGRQRTASHSSHHYHHPSHRRAPDMAVQFRRGYYPSGGLGLILIILLGAGRIPLACTRPVRPRGSSISLALSTRGRRQRERGPAEGQKRHEPPDPDRLHNLKPEQNPARVGQRGELRLGRGLRYALALSAGCERVDRKQDEGGGEEDGGADQTRVDEAVPVQRRDERRRANESQCDRRGRGAGPGNRTEKQSPPRLFLPAVRGSVEHAFRQRRQPSPSRKPTPRATATEAIGRSWIASVSASPMEDAASSAEPAIEAARSVASDAMAPTWPRARRMPRRA